MFFLQSIATSLTVSAALLGHRKVAWNVSTPDISYFPSVFTRSNVNVMTRPIAPAESGGLRKQTIEIIVGAAGQLLFNPSSVNVMKGTILRFNFLKLNHTLTQSSFSHPCSNSSQFDTGFRQYNPLNITGKYLVDFEVDSYTPQWFYCAQESPQSHCHAGMVFSLNPEGKQSQYINNAYISIPHPLITPPPSLNYCSRTQALASSSRVRPSDGTTSRNWQRPNTTSITPQISNNGGRLGYWIGYCFAGFLMVFGI